MTDEPKKCPECGSEKVLWKSKALGGMACCLSCGRAKKVEEFFEEQVR